MIDGTLASDSEMTLDDVESSMQKTMSIADIDDNGEVDALTDGLIVLRYLLGLFESNTIFSQALESIIKYPESSPFLHGENKLAMAEYNRLLSTQRKVNSLLRNLALIEI